MAGKLVLQGRIETHQPKPSLPAEAASPLEGFADAELRVSLYCIN